MISKDYDSAVPVKNYNCIVYYSMCDWIIVYDPLKLPKLSDMFRDVNCIYRILHQILQSKYFVCKLQKIACCLLDWDPWGWSRHSVSLAYIMGRKVDDFALNFMSLQFPHIYASTDVEHIPVFYHNTRYAHVLQLTKAYMSIRRYSTHLKLMKMMTILLNTKVNWILTKIILIS